MYFSLVNTEVTPLVHAACRAFTRRRRRLQRRMMFALMLHVACAGMLCAGGGRSGCVALQPYIQPLLSLHHFQEENILKLSIRFYPLFRRRRLRLRRCLLRALRQRRRSSRRRCECERLLGFGFFSFGFEVGCEACSGVKGVGCSERQAVESEHVASGLPRCVGVEFVLVLVLVFRFTEVQNLFGHSCSARSMFACEIYIYFASPTCHPSANSNLQHLVCG